MDVLAHYDVLEHIPNVRDFMTACHRALKDKRGDGVRSARCAPLSPESRAARIRARQSFLGHTLAAIAQTCGLRLIEAGHICSRPYGFAAVLRKDVPRANQPITGPFEYVDTLACVRGGINHNV